MKKKATYLFPIFLYFIFSFILSKIQNFWWDKKTFDDTFYFVLNGAILFEIIIILFWELKILDKNFLILKGVKKWHFLLAIMVGLVIFIFNLNSSHWFSLPITENTNTLDTILSYSNGHFVLEGYLLWNIFLGPIREEFFDRMLLMDTYFKNSPYYLDIILSAIVFGLRHLAAGWSSTSFIIYAIPGILYALVYRFTGKIYWSILIHILWNAYVFYDLLFLIFS